MRLARVSGRWVFAGCVVAACGGAGAWGTASITGLPGASVTSVIVDTAGSGYDGGAALPSKLDIELVDNRGVLDGVPACHLYQSNGTLTGTAVYLAFNSGNGQPLTATTYPIQIPPQCSPSCTDAGAYAVLSLTDWEQVGGSYNGTNLGDGVSGTATLTELDTTTVAGNFTASVVGDDGGSYNLSGTFSGPFCVKQQ